MDIYGDTITFHSDPENYENEIADKNCTIRELEGEELREFKNTELHKIIIINNENWDSIVRIIAGAQVWRAEYHTRKNKTSYYSEDWLIWWKPELKKRGRRPRGDGEEAVIEKRM